MVGFGRHCGATLERLHYGQNLVGDLAMGILIIVGIVVGILALRAENRARYKK